MYGNRSRWEILCDVLDACDYKNGACLTTIMRKANLNTLYAELCIAILVESNLLQVIDHPTGNPRQNNNTKTYPCYVKTSKGKAFLDLFDNIEKMLENPNEDPKYSLARAWIHDGISRARAVFIVKCLACMRAWDTPKIPRELKAVAHCCE